MNKWMQKALAALLVGGACLLPAAAAAVPSQWAQREVTAAQEAGLVAAELTVDYQATITRQQFAALAVGLVERAAGATLPLAALDTFADCTDPAVRKAYAVGLVEGTAPGVFSPQGLLTRQELAVMLAGALGEVRSQTGIALPTRTADLAAYDDGDQVAAWAQSSFAWMAGTGLLRGTTETTLAPQAPCTVEQSILLTWRGYELATTGRLPMVGKSQAALTAQMEGAVGATLALQLFEDLNGDGVRELTGAFQNAQGYWELWYAAADGSVCRLVYRADRLWESGQLTLSPQEGESYVTLLCSDGGGEALSLTYALRGVTLTPAEGEQVPLAPFPEEPVEP